MPNELLHIIEKVLNPDESLIPKGSYCYQIKSVDKETGKLDTKRCPYWRWNNSYENGAYCAFLGSGDYEDDGTLLLHDSVKECSVNIEEDEENN